MLKVPSQVVRIGGEERSVEIPNRPLCQICGILPLGCLSLGARHRKWIQSKDYTIQMDG